MLLSVFDANKGICRGYPTDWWYPDKGKENYNNSKKAVTICKQCPIKQQCLDYSLVNETHGIWGGLRESEREIERRRLNIQLSPEALSSISASTRRIIKRLDEEEKSEYSSW